MRSHTSTVALLLGLPMAALAQVPAHATLLNPTTVQQYPTVLHDADDVHVFGFSFGTLLHARSRDGGRTWPLREVALGNYFGDLAYGTAVVGPGQLLAVGLDQSIGPVHWRSADHGSSWSATTPLFTVAFPPGSGELAVLADGPSAIVVWRSNSELRCRRTLDGGVTWQPATVLATWGSGGSYLHSFRSGNVLDVFWNGGFSGLRHQRSTDGGASWLSPAATVSSQALHHAASNGTEMLVHQGGTNTLLYSTNGGTTWTQKTVPGMPYPREMAAAGTVMAVVGTTAYPGLGPNTYVVSVSTDAGLTWPASPLLLPSPVSWQTQVILEDGVVYVRFYAGDTLGVVTSRDGGASWQLVGGSVSAGFWPGPRRTVSIVLTAGPPSSYGNFHAYVGLGSTTLGTGTPGAGGFVPRLEGVGLPFQGAATTLAVTDIVGGSLGALGISFAAPVPVPLGSAVLWPTVAPIVLPFATGGTAGLPGTGGHSLPIAVPVNPALVGASFTSQALVFDAANPDGFAVSNALETWLR